MVKPLKFKGSSRDDLRAFPDEARRLAGFQLFDVQCGLEPADWRAMPSVAPGVCEIRLHVQGEWRVIYVAKFSDAVYVLHAFQKKTQQTRVQDIRLARERYQQIGRRS